MTTCGASLRDDTVLVPNSITADPQSCGMSRSKLFANTPPDPGNIPPNTTLPSGSTATAQGVRSPLNAALKQKSGEPSCRSRAMRPRGWPLIRENVPPTSNLPSGRGSIARTVALHGNPGPSGSALKPRSMDPSVWNRKSRGLLAMKPDSVFVWRLPTRRPSGCRAPREIRAVRPSAQLNEVSTAPLVCSRTTPAFRAASRKAS